MNKIEKVTRWAMLALFITVIPMSIINGNYSLASWQFIASMWFGISWSQKNTIDEMTTVIKEAVDRVKNLSEDDQTPEQPLN